MTQVQRNAPPREASSNRNGADPGIEHLAEGIVHFDATRGRRMRLRDQAQGEGGTRPVPDGTSQCPRAASPSPATPSIPSSGSRGSESDEYSTGAPARAGAEAATDSGERVSPWWQRVMRDFSEGGTVADASASSSTAATESGRTKR